MKVNGEYEIEAFMELIKCIKSEGEKSDHHRVVCDIREVRNVFPSDTDRFWIGTSIAEVIGSQIRIACVAAPESINHFVELVANNRGVNFKIFSCIDAARQWILEDNVSSPRQQTVSR